MREEKKLSSGDLEKRTGLLDWYISRVESGHTVPATETLEKLAQALEGGDPPKLSNLPKEALRQDRLE